MTKPYPNSRNSRAESSSPFGVSVQLGDNDGGHIHFLLKSTRLSFTGLPYAGIHHKHHILRTLYKQVEKQPVTGHGIVPFNKPQYKLKTSSDSETLSKMKSLCVCTQFCIASHLNNRL